MYKFIKSKKQDNNLYTSVDGMCISLDDVADKAFANRLMGDGVAFTFTQDSIHAYIGNIYTTKQKRR